MAVTWDEMRGGHVILSPSRKSANANWSFNADRSFEEYLRIWLSQQVVAHYAAKDSLRREVHLLSKLDSLWSWRGRPVDDAITRRVVTLLAVPTLPTLLAAARGRYETQLAFAAAQPVDATTSTAATGIAPGGTWSTPAAT